MAQAAVTIAGMNPERLIKVALRPDGVLVVTAPDGATHRCHSDAEIARAVRTIVADRTLGPVKVEPPRAGAREVLHGEVLDGPPPGRKSATAQEIEDGEALAAAALERATEELAGSLGPAVANAGARVASRAGRGAFKLLRKLSRKGAPPTLPADRRGKGTK